MRIAILGLFVLAISGNVYAACPEDFGDFLREFQSDKEFRRTNTRFPVNYLYVNNDGLEPAPVEVVVREADLPKYPRLEFPSERVEVDVPLKQTISIASGRFVVSFNQPDSDAYSLKYIFERAESCWFLIRVENWSL